MSFSYFAPDCKIRKTKNTQVDINAFSSKYQNKKTFPQKFLWSLDEIEMTGVFQWLCEKILRA